MTHPSEFRKSWQLHPEVTFLNHGSFGATPTVVLDEQRRLRDALESEPIRFLAPERDLEPKLDHMRAVMGELLGARDRDIAWVSSATDGVNAVLRSFPFGPGDEILITNLGYSACTYAAQFAAERAGAMIRVAEIPFPIDDPDQVVQAIGDALSNRTRLLLVDHVTSATGLILPLSRIVPMAQDRGVRVLVDGAHAPGMIPLNLTGLNADYYTGNHHKWLCGPKASAFLWVRGEYQRDVRPTVISHGADRVRPDRTRFITEFDWAGTFDPTPLLSVPTAIDFLNRLMPGGLAKLMDANRQLALDARKLLTSRLGITPPAPSEMVGSMVTLPIPISNDKVAWLKQTLFQIDRIEVPVIRGQESAMIRISAQAYNHISDYEKLADALGRWIE